MRICQSGEKKRIMLKVHKDVILSNLSVLVEETDLNKLIPELLNRNIFNERMINRILNPSHNPKRQKTDLYTELLKRGPQAFGNLQCALESTNHLKLSQLLRDTEAQLRPPDIATPSSTSSDLNLSQSPARYDGPMGISINARSFDEVDPNNRESGFNFSSHLNVQNGRFFTSQNDAQSENVLDIAKELNECSIETPADLHCRMFKYPSYLKKWEEALENSGFPFSNNVIVCSNERFLPVKVKYAFKFKEQNEVGPAMYKMDSDPRGLALIINNITFDDSEEYKTRFGADNDEYRLKLLLEQLHFNVEVHQNKTKREMLEITDNFSKRGELSECDSVIVTFMSHGEEGDTEDNSKIVGVDGLSVAINDIVSYFYNDACKALINKPKIFFFQACRGVLEDTGVLLDNFIPRNRIEKDGRQVRIPFNQSRIRSQSDIFMACPVPPGRKANRDRITGTWFIQTIIDVFSEHAWNTHLEDMMKMVDMNIRNTNNFYTLNFQALTTKTIGWNKNLYFNPGLAKHKLTGETIRIGDSQSYANSNDEGMDVVDSMPEVPKKPCQQNSAIKNYSKLKEEEEEKGDSDSDERKSRGCYNFLGCNTL